MPDLVRRIRWTNLARALALLLMALLALVAVRGKDREPSLPATLAEPPATVPDGSDEGTGALPGETTPTTAVPASDTERTDREDRDDRAERAEARRTAAAKKAATRSAARRAAARRAAQRRRTAARKRAAREAGAVDAARHVGTAGRPGPGPGVAAPPPPGAEFRP
jgi:hypothetical protein